MVRLTGVSKSFAGPRGETVPVLREVQLTLLPGEKASLIGPSGSGKSTLLSLIAGLLQPDEGSVEIDGVALGELDEPSRARLRSQRIGIALQSDNLVPFLSARENVELALAFGGPLRRREARARALELLERFGVAHRAGHRPRHLSGGEAQRVALAVAMANAPALLLADEVVAQLDADTAGRVVDEVLTGDLAVLYVTHERSLADRVERRFELRELGIHERQPVEPSRGARRPLVKLGRPKRAGRAQRSRTALTRRRRQVTRSRPARPLALGRRSTSYLTRKRPAVR